MTTSTSSDDSKPWHAAYPAPTTTQPGAVSREEMLELLGTGVVGKDYVLVDLRRNDYEVRPTAEATHLSRHALSLEENNHLRTSRDGGVSGRHHQDIHQPPSTVSASQHPRIVRALCRGGRQAGNLVLR